MKIFFFLFFLIPNLTLSLTFKDGKQVDESQINNNFEKKFQALAGYQIENKVLNINFPPFSPNVVRDKYWFGWFWTAQDFNNDGYLDYLYSGTMKPNNIEITGETTGGACGGERCEGEMPGPTLFLGNKEGQYVLSSHLLMDNRDLSGQSLSRQNLVADFNNDGVLDLFIADHGVGTHKGIRDSYFLSQDDGTWIESSDTHLGKSNYMIFDHGGAVGDIDNDGDIDIVLTELKNQLTCWINEGDGVMTYKVCGNIHAFAIELGDMNGDGYLDIINAGHEGGPSTDTGIVLNNGSGYFKKRISLPMIPKWTTIPELSIWDLDDDGDLDITVSRAGHLYVGVAIQIIENQGNNKFDSQLHVLLEAPADYVPEHEGNEWNNFVQNFLFGDFDKDGDPDILLVTHLEYEHKHIGGSILKNNGSMKFVHIPNGEKGNPINLIHDSKFILNSNDKDKVTEFKKIPVVDLDDYTYLKEEVYFGSIDANLIAAKLLDNNNDFYMYSGLFEKDTNRFFITLCSEYYEKFRFIGNRVGTVYDNGFMGNSDLKEYGKSSCSYHDGFLGHWEDDADRLKEMQTSLSPFLFEIEHKWKDVLDNLLVLSEEEKNYYFNNWIR